MTTLNSLCLNKSRQENKMSIDVEQRFKVYAHLLKNAYKNERDNRQAILYQWFSSKNKTHKYDSIYQHCEMEILRLVNPHFDSIDLDSIIDQYANTALSYIYFSMTLKTMFHHVEQSNDRLMKDLNDRVEMIWNDMIEVYEKDLKDEAVRRVAKSQQITRLNEIIYKGTLSRVQALMKEFET